MGSWKQIGPSTFKLTHPALGYGPPAITLLGGGKANIYWQCIYLDANNNDLKVSNVTLGLPGHPDTGRARKDPWPLTVLARGSRVDPAAHHRCLSVEIRRGCNAVAQTSIDQ
jgi:hypothetical protein